MIARFVWILLIVTVVAAVTCEAAQPTTETIRVGIPGKLVDFSPFFVGVKTGIYRSEGLEPQFIVMRSGIIFSRAACRRAGLHDALPVGDSLRD